MEKPILELIRRAETVLDRLAAVLPRGGAALDWARHVAAVWRPGPLGGRLEPLTITDDIGLDDLLDVDDQKARIDANTRQFVAGYPANNALLWGSRGTGKSSLIHAVLNAYSGEGLRLVEVDKYSLGSLPDIVFRLESESYRFIIFCDDLSFEADDAAYKELKSMLDGSVFAASENVVIYATSNRRHLLPEYMEENQQASVHGTELHHGEAVEEKISLSDRFGLWISFYPFKQDEYLEIVRHWLEVYAARHGLKCEWSEELRADALRWALGRGSRSGRTANHFARHWVGSALLEGNG
jgi:predicted AAA+ superfamily ATPase